jgi:hypothetical protein
MYGFRAAITCLGTMYEKLGRLMGRSYEDTVQLLLKSIKSAEVCNGLYCLFCDDRCLIITMSFSPKPGVRYTRH